jgi:UDP-2,3-diacylglucosamine pyrophosphatase LpxH
MGTMKTRLFVISDLHLGGAPANDGKPAFRMCSETGRERLVAFIEWVTTQKVAGDADVHLVIAGDIVDFLAESRPQKQFSAFTADDREAHKKLCVIIDDTREIWDALKRMTQAGAALTLMLGNHDLELCLPEPRRRLIESVSPGRVEFVYDNQAFTFGPVLIEHGNRYDGWNAVKHNKLREARSLISRRESGTFEPLPGSHMVIELVNPLKQNLSFVDLLKPETAALLPLLAFLDPHKYEDTKTFLKQQIQASRVRYDESQQPLDLDFAAASRVKLARPSIDTLDPAAGTGDAEDDRLFALADSIAGGGDPAMAGSIGSFFERWKDRLAEQYKETQLRLLYEALRSFSDKHYRAFNVEQEDEVYLKAATESAVLGFEVIVYGHTHLAKRISLNGRTALNKKSVQNNAVYLNSGTWADLMAVPATILDGTDSQASYDALLTFANDLASNQIDHWRRSVPTFVNIELDGDRVIDAQVMLFGSDGNSQPLTTELLRRCMQGGL